MKTPVFVHKNGPVEIHQIPARTDNYIYVFRDSDRDFTAVIDPTEADLVLDLCRERSWRLGTVLITHHHPDHTGGNLKLKAAYGMPIWGLKEDSLRIPGITDYFTKQGHGNLGGHDFEILFTPGHTLGHVCLHFSKLGWLFCGDTLFSFGCGRLFEGTPEMMLESLRKIRALPPETYFFCSHEYTVSNLEFALSLEPESTGLRDMHAEMSKLRGAGLPTVPARLERELRLNPFLRWDDPVLRKALGMESATDLEVFTTVRMRRNRW